MFREQRSARGIVRRFGAAVDSPIDPFNRHPHRRDFVLRVPPSTRAVGGFFAARGREPAHARKEAVACGDHVMSTSIYIVGVRASELCLMRMKDPAPPVGPSERLAPDLGRADSGAAGGDDLDAAEGARGRALPVGAGGWAQGTPGRVAERERGPARIPRPGTRPALARLSARHEEIVHLRATLTQARPVTRPPAARNTVIGSCG